MMMRLFGCFLALMSMPVFIRAQNAVDAPIGIAHIAIRASDVAREVEFLGKLGFQQAFANTESGRTTQAFVKVNDRQFIEVYPVGASGESAGPAGLMHICYEVSDLQALNDHYAKIGLKPASWRKAGAGNLLFNLQDPDGRVTEFTQYMPGSRQMNDMGQHLGASRISDELIGIDVPVRDMKATQSFYEAMGFSAVKDGGKMLFELAANPDVRIVVQPARAGDKPQFIFAVDDLRRAEDQLQDAELKPVREKKQVFVRDPDGNIFVMVETSEKGSRRLIPWKKR